METTRLLHAPDLIWCATLLEGVAPRQVYSSLLFVEQLPTVSSKHPHCSMPKGAALVMPL